MKYPQVDPQAGDNWPPSSTWLKDALAGGEITQEQYDAFMKRHAEELKENDVLGGAPSEEELRTKTGKVLTGDDLDKLADEADMGYTSVDGKGVPVRDVLLKTTDASEWAEHFVAQFGDSEADEATMTTWFANAIEVGRSQGRKELCPHVFSRLGPNLWACTHCGKLSEGDNWPDNSPPLVSEVEIGGQRMTQAQFDAARFPLLSPDPGPVIDELASEEEVKEFVDDIYPPQPLATQEWVEHRLSEVRNHLVVVTKAEIDKRVSATQEWVRTQYLPLIEGAQELIQELQRHMMALEDRERLHNDQRVDTEGNMAATLGEVRQWSKDLAVKVAMLEQRGSNAHVGTIMETGYKNEAEIKALDQRLIDVINTQGYHSHTLADALKRLVVLEQDRDKLLRPEVRNTLPRHPGSYFDEGEEPSIHDMVGWLRPRTHRDAPEAATSPESWAAGWNAAVTTWKTMPK